MWREVSVLITSVLCFWSGVPARAQDAACRPFPINSISLAQKNPELAAGDFNGDGRIDYMALTVQGLSVFLNNGNGTFRSAGQFPAPTSGFVGQVITGDFNGDGKLDVAEADAGHGIIYVIPGNGDGTFGKPIGSPITAGTEFLAAGDFNHDGKLDLAALAANAEAVQVLPGNGDGTFQAPATYSIGNMPDDEAGPVAIADFNGDGNLDLAVANYGSSLSPGRTVSLLLGKSDGTFQPVVQYAIGGFGPHGIVAADFNGDGKMDVATANQGDGSASVLLGRGDGTFQTAVVYTITGQPGTVNGIAAAPFDPGSRSSLAVATSAGTFVLVNNGNGAFSAARGYSPATSVVVAADFDGDGRADLLLNPTGDNAGVLEASVGLLRGQGHGAFATSRAFAQGLGYGLDQLVVGDFNGDGIPDLVVTDPPSNLIAFMAGDGHGSFSGQTILQTVVGASNVAAGDLNGDGKLDLAVVGNDLVQILLGNGDGTFTVGAKLHPLGAFGVLCCVALGDFNGDGVLDIAVVGTGLSPTPAVISILLGNGDGTFQNAVGYGSGLYYLQGLKLGDFNGDGKLDLAVAQIDYMGGMLNSPAMNIYLGNGDGTFQAAVQTPLAAQAVDFVAADFNGDGILDMAVALSNLEQIQILSGDGNGGFQPGVVFPTLPGWPPGGFLGVADFNGDGKADLVFSANEGFLQFFPGHGDGTFGSGLATFAGLTPGTPVVANLTAQGGPDVVLPNYTGGSVSVYLNRCKR